MKPGPLATVRLMMLLLLAQALCPGGWRAPPVPLTNDDPRPVAFSRGDSPTLLADMREEKDRVVYGTLPVDPHENDREEWRKQENAWQMLMNLPGPVYRFPRGDHGYPDDPTRNPPAARPR